MVLRRIEERLERLVEGSFARAFRSGLQPVELARRVARAVDTHRSVGTDGQPIAANAFVLRLSPDDHDRLDPLGDALLADLRSSARQQSRSSGLRFAGPVRVRLVADESVREGTVAVDATFDASPPTGVHGELALPDGTRVALTAAPVSLGRRPESTIVVNDPNASRAHAELRLVGDGYELHDLGSTNGTRVNGHRIDRCLLAEGDRIEIGSVSLVLHLR